MSLKIYRCDHCGNIIVHLKDSGVRVVCCGETMKELVPASVDAAVEKHVPVVEIKGKDVNVSVGSVNHPMIAAHYIEWVLLETNKGYKVNFLKPEQEPKTSFTLSEDEEVVNVYAYCNLHGLWKADL